MADPTNSVPHDGDNAGDGAAGALLRRRTVLGAAALAAIGAGTYLGVSSYSSSPPPPPKASPKPSPKPKPTPTPPKPTPLGNPLTGIGVAGRVLAAKIDNVGYPQFEQSGLNSASLVYVIQVEGGLSRYLAVFDSNHAPARVGPIRSARQTDIPLLAAYGRVGLAYSGAIYGLLRPLSRANLQNITPADAMRLFSNGGSDPTYIRPHDVFAAYPHLAPAQDIGLHFGAAPPGGQPAAFVSVSMPSADFTFTASRSQWLLAVDGHQAFTTDQGRTSMDNVILQHVHIKRGLYTDHNAGHPDNEAFSQTTGNGAADFYRDGRVWHGQWSKPTDTSPTAYTVGGAPFPLRPGRTWIVLDPIEHEVP
ncbi:MAG TPA: DUF3048 domain-containing protein [Actinocrinis sp.]|uniref:DUF3048 domain-containing protein n=1 Tax=Actinocrinis sp. TaxID=1920516 RepID=UPI002DDD4CFD|nr:DUF3048 domain-containing protein [Actinocrinis sp.]HEV2346871.1 DUF3048 domain-containing protein [Actinocrinis sp.]